jgi:leucyl-tRNA synthetase
MELSNYLAKQEKISTFILQDFIKLLSPFAPHIAEELWHRYGNGNSIAFALWPIYDERRARRAELTIAIQVNGKLRDTIIVPTDTPEETIKQQALASEKIQTWLQGKAPKKIIYVKGKLLSIVV